MLRTKKVILIGLLAGIGLVLAVVESMIPMSAVIPGAKPGLANIVNLVGLVMINISAGFQVLMLRIILGSLLTGTFMTFPFFMSFFGGITGYLAMAAGYYFFENRLSVIGISVLGAVFHNVGQIITASVVMSTTGIFYYLPYLTLLAVPTGIGIGIVALFSFRYFEDVD
ncbi:MAG: Gx transporter family protein [Bacillota bacterium]